MGGWKNVHCVLVMEFIIEFISEFPLKWNKTGWQCETESIYLIPRMNFWLWELVAQGWFGLTSGKWNIVCRHGEASPTDRVCSGEWVDICRDGPASPSDRVCSGEWDVVYRYGQASPTDGVCSGEWDDICRHGPASPSDGVCSESYILRRFHL